MATEAIVDQFDRAKNTSESLDKKILIIAGPNGAGKTTFAREFLPREANCFVFINADLIASGFSPFDPEAVAIKAGRIMLDEIKAYAEAGTSFAFETTLSGRGYVRLIKSWRNSGYHVKLYFLALNSVEEALARVAARVSQGGHNIPETVISRRFLKGRQLFEEVYKYEVDEWSWYDNSEDSPILVREGRNT